MIDIPIYVKFWITGSYTMATANLRINSACYQTNRRNDKNTN